MNREIYSTNGEISLVRLSKADKDNYIELLRQTMSHPEFFDDSMKADLMWKATIDGKDRDYSIYDKNGEYCGNVMIKRPQESIPELGIDLLENKRNQGIAGIAIKLLAKKVYEERPIDYFLLRVSTQNIQSKRMIEKLGAIPMGTELESPFIQDLRKNISRLEREGDCELAKRLRECIDDLQKNKEAILQYKLTSDLFLEIDCK